MTEEEFKESRKSHYKWVIKNVIENDAFQLHQKLNTLYNVCGDEIKDKVLFDFINRPELDGASDEWIITKEKMREVWKEYDPDPTKFHIDIGKWLEKIYSETPDIVMEIDLQIDDFKKYLEEEIGE